MTPARCSSAFEVTHDAAGLHELLARLRRLVADPGAVADRHRAPLRAGRRYLGRGRLPGGPHPSQRRQGDPARAIAATAPRAMPRMPTCSPTCCAPTALASHRCSRSPMPIRALRALVRGRDDLVATRVQLANQLRSLLESFWPGAAAIFAEIDSPIALGLRAALSDSASAAAAARSAWPRSSPSTATAAAAARQPCSNACAPRPPATPLSSKPMPSAPSSQALAASLTALVEQIAQLTARIEHTVADLPDGQLVMSLPRAGQRLRRADPRRARRRARALSHRRPIGRRGRRRAAHLRVRQEPQRHLPLGLQPSLAARHHLLRR